MKINSRGTADAECGSTTGNEDEEWRTVRINDCFLALNVGILSHVSVSPFEIFETPAGVNREHEGRVELRIGTSGAHSEIDITKATSGEIVANLDSEG